MHINRIGSGALLIDSPSLERHIPQSSSLNASFIGTTSLYSYISGIIEGKASVNGEMKLFGRIGWKNLEQKYSIGYETKRRKNSRQK